MQEAGQGPEGSQSWHRQRGTFINFGALPLSWIIRMVTLEFRSEDRIIPRR
jgi:hypothetical protein